MHFEEIIHNGKTYFFSGRSDDPITMFHARYSKFYELDLLEALSERLEAVGFGHRLIIDGGAHVGNHTVFFSEQFPDSQIYSFEMNPETYKYLVANVERNGLSNVQTFNLGLSDSLGTAGVRSDAGNPLGGAQLDFQASDQNVKLITLDHFVDQDSLEVGLLKLDVEGHELRCLKGARQMLVRSRPIVFLEIKELNDFDEILRWFSELDYRILCAEKGATPNFTFIHRDLQDVLATRDREYQILRDLCRQHVGSWQLRRRINELESAIDGFIQEKAKRES